jgi:tripartite-type tricarboxylate transporter receptor subunit TctC
MSILRQASAATITGPLSSVTCRRALFAGTAAALAMPAVAQPAWPNRPVRFIVGFGAGGLTDTLARLAAPGFQAALGQPIVIENRPGAAGNIGSEAAIRANDGHTFLIVNSGQLTINPHTFERLGFDPMRELVPVARMMALYFVMTVNAQVPAQTHAELVSLMRARPGQLAYATAGGGGITHVATEAWRRMVGVESDPIHFRSSAAAIPDLLANRVPIFMDAALLLKEHVDSGRLRALFTTRQSREPSMPDVPTTREVGIPQLDTESWFGMYAPRGTPRDIVQRLSKISRSVMQQPMVRDRLAAGGADSVPSSPEELQAIAERDFRMFGEIVRAGNIRAE